MLTDQSDALDTEMEEDMWLLCGKCLLFLTIRELFDFSEPYWVVSIEQVAKDGLRRETELYKTISNDLELLEQEL